MWTSQLQSGSNIKNFYKPIEAKDCGLVLNPFTLIDIDLIPKSECECSYMHNLHEYRTYN